MTTNASPRATMGTAADPEVTTALAALDGLVTQFSSALDFYRELVQNGIDAGSSRIDVRLELLGAEADTIAIHVDDYGEGMDEAIIDHELTTLFASSKEDDLTKIGKFGIGFVSIFAMRPKAVLLHTGKHGQYWEVLFHEDRSFTKSRIETPVEGTQITLFLAGGRARYAELVEASRRTLKRWCRHSDTEVWLEDLTDNPGKPELVNEPFTIAGEVATHVVRDDTEITLAYRDEPTYGFFNKGLTLLETGDAEEALGVLAPQFRRIGFKMKSQYLEHTLSRQTILREQNYERALLLLQEAAAGPLLEALVHELETLAQAPELTAAVSERLVRLADFLADAPDPALGAVAKRPLLRTLAGAPISLVEAAEACDRDGRVLLASRASVLTDALAAQGVPVVLAASAPLPSTAVGAASPAAPTDGDVEPPAAPATTRPQPIQALLVRYLAARDRGSVLGRVEAATGINLRADVRASSTWLGYDPLSAVARAAPRVVFAERALVSVAIDVAPPPALAPLLEDVATVLSRSGAGYARLASCVLTTATAEPPLFVTARRLGPVMWLPPAGAVGAEHRGRLEVAVNRDHPELVRWLTLHPRRRQLVAYALARELLLASDRAAVATERLVAAAQALEGVAAPAAGEIGA